MLRAWWPLVTDCGAAYESFIDQGQAA